MKKLPIYNITLNGAEGIQKMSLVEYPAVEDNFLKFEDEKQLKFSIDEDKRIVFGVALRANFPIYRCDYKGEYYVVFSPDVIRDLYEKFMIDGRFNLINLDHSKDTNGVHLIQSFIKSVKDGITPVGFEHIADGSWFVAYKIDNEDVWRSVKEGKFNGFSVEGFFNLEESVEEKSDFEKLLDALVG